VKSKRRHNEHKNHSEEVSDAPVATNRGASPQFIAESNAGEWRAPQLPLRSSRLVPRQWIAHTLVDSTSTEGKPNTTTYIDPYSHVFTASKFPKKILHITEQWDFRLASYFV
jgi:hypothetical protein